MKQKKDRSRITYNNAVDQLNIDKDKFSVHNLIDYDDKYLNDLKNNPEAKAWLSQFTDEYYNGRFDRTQTHGEKSILANKKDLIKEYARIKKNPEEYKAFQQELFEENQTKTGGYATFRYKAYNRFCKLVKTQDKEELKKFNKYVKGNYELPVKMKDWVDPDESITPKAYRVSGPLVFLRDKIIRERSNTVTRLKKDVVGRDYEGTKLVNTESATEGRDVKPNNEFVDLMSLQRPDLTYGLSQGYDEMDETLEAWERLKGQGRLDLFIENMFFDNLTDFIDVEPDKIYAEKINMFVKEVYSKRQNNKMTKVMYFWNLCIANFSMVTHLHNNGRELGKIGVLDKLFNKFVFKYKKDNNKNMVLDIPKEFEDEG